MKKILILGLILICGSYVYSATNLKGTSSSYPINITNEVGWQDCSQLPVNDAVFQIGDSSHRYLTIYSSGVGGGILQTESWLDLPTASSVAVYNVEITTTIALSSTVYAGVFTQPAVPRNLTFCLEVIALVPITSHTVTGGQVVITGIDARGETITETTTINSTKIVSFSSAAYSYVTSLALTATRFAVGDISACNFKVGLGNKIGICGEVNYASDILSVNEAGTKTTTYTLDLDKDTIDFVTDGDASNDYKILFKNYDIP